MVDGTRNQDGTFSNGNPGGPGRPSVFSTELADRLCDGLRSGMTLRAVCRQECVHEQTVRMWAADRDHPFSAQYAKAREIGYHSMADELVEISDDGSNDWMERHDKDNPGYEANGEHLQRSRLRVDTRKWLLSKALPKMYGDRTVNEHVGKDGTDLIPCDATLDARAIAFMLGRAVGRAEKAAKAENNS